MSYVLAVLCWVLSWVAFHSHGGGVGDVLGILLFLGGWVLVIRAID